MSVARSGQQICLPVLYFLSASDDNVYLWIDRIVSLRSSRGTDMFALRGLSRRRYLGSVLYCLSTATPRTEPGGVPAGYCSQPSNVHIGFFRSKSTCKCGYTMIAGTRIPHCRLHTAGTFGQRVPANTDITRLQIPGFFTVSSTRSSPPVKEYLQMRIYYDCRYPNPSLSAPHGRYFRSKGTCKYGYNTIADTRILNSRLRAVALII